MNINNNIDCDTQKLYDTTVEMNNLIVEYKKKINEFFNRLDFISHSGQAWAGPNANIYSKVVALDKPDYDNFGQEMEDLVKELQDFCLDLDSTITKAEESCKDDKDLYGFLSSNSNT